MLDESEKKIFEITQKRVGSNFDNISDIMLRTVDSIEAAYKSEGKITGIPTGFVDLDTKLQGFHKSDFILVAARPAMGKTAFVLNIAEHMVLREKKNVALFSLEMSCEQLAKRLIAMQANVDAQKIGKGDLSADDWKKVIDGVNSLGASNLFVCDKSGITLSEIRSKCRKLQIERGLDMVIIDYLQLMESDRRRASDNRQNEISAISRGLKVMARELDIPVVTLSQLSRAVESRTDKRPMLSDLRESGAIEQDADIVMFIYRDEYYNKENSKDPGVAEVIVAKHRNGPVGTEKLAWVGKYTKFSNLDKSYYARKES
jgi:replicative DNA helicase